MADFQPLHLSAQEMTTKALPDQAPGRTDDAVSNVVKDSDIQSTDDYSAMAGRLESGELDGLIEHEEMLFSQRQNPQSQASQGEPGPQGGAETDQTRPQHKAGEQDDDYAGSEPFVPGIYPEIHQNPLYPDLKVPNPDPIPATGLFDKGQSQEPTQADPSQATAQEQYPAQRQDDQPPQHRVRGDDDVERLALELVTQANKAGGKLKLAKALEMAADSLGVQSEGTDEQAFEIPEGMPATQDALQSELDQIELDKITAMEEAEFDTLRDLQARLVELKKWGPQLESIQKEQETAYNTSFSASMDHVQNLYPMVKDSDGEFAREMAAIDAQLLASGDDRYYATNKPMLIAQWVAKRQGVLPMVPPVTGSGSQTQGDQRSRQQAVPPRAFQAEPPVPASGHARSNANQGRTQTLGGMDLDNLTEDQFYALKDSL